MTPDDSSDQQPGAAEPLGVLRAELLAAAREVAAAAPGRTARPAGEGCERPPAVAAGAGRPGDARAPAAGGVRGLLDQRRARARARPGDQAARARRVARRGAARADAGGARAFRGGGPGVPEPVPVRLLADGGARPGARGRPRLRLRGGLASQRILVEFVSANPTGPMHVGHARNAAYGDALARMLAAHGHSVEREFYVNDAGAQIRKLRGVGERGGARRAAARGRLPRRLRGRAGGSRSPAPASATRPTSAARPMAQMVQNMQDVLAAFRVRELSTAGPMRASCTRVDPSAVERTIAALTEARAHVHQRRGPVAADHRVRRRQGPRADPLQRRAHLLRLRHRLPPEPSRAGLRAPDRHLGSRPPRLPAAHEGRLRGPRGRSRGARAADHAAGAPGAGRRAGADVKAGGRVRDARGARARRSGWTPPAGICWPAPTTPPWTSTSTWLASSRPRTRCTTSSTPTPASPRSWRRPGRLGCRRRWRPRPRPPQAPLHPAERALIEQLLAFPG